MHLSDLKKYVACCLTFGFNAFNMPLTFPQGSLQLFFNIDVKIMENRLLSCLRMPLTLPQRSLQPFFHIDVKIMENKLLSCLRTQ